MKCPEIKGLYITFDEEVTEKEFNEMFTIACSWKHVDDVRKIRYSFLEKCVKFWNTARRIG